MHIISWIMSLLALFGWGVTIPAAGSHHQPTKPAAIARAPLSPDPTPGPSKLPVPKPTVTPIPTATPTPVAPGAPAEIASEATCPGQSDTAKTIQALTCLTSNARVFHGLKPVSDSQALLAATTAKAQDMAKCGYGHTACGLPFDHEILANGYTGQCYGENIAMGQRSPRDVFVAWMNSPEHRANILNAKYRDFGVAETPGSQGPLWVMELGGC